MAYEIELDARVVSELSEIVSWYAGESFSISEKFETAFSWLIESLSTGIIDLRFSQMKSGEHLFRDFHTWCTTAEMKNYNLFLFMQSFIPNAGRISL